VNCSTMTEVPPELVEVIWLSPATGRTAAPAAPSRGRHHNRTGARIEGNDLDRRIIDLGSAETGNCV